MSNPALWCLLLPLAFAGLTFTLGRRSSPWFLVGVAFASLAAVLLETRLVWTDGPQRYELGGWGPPLGIDLYVDGLTCVMLLMTSSIILLLGLYSLAYFHDERPAGVWTERQAFTPLSLFMLAGLNALFLSADVFNVYLCLEITSLSGVALVVIAGGRDALLGAMRYLLAAFSASLFYLLGVVLLYGEYGVLDFHLLRDLAIQNPPSQLAVSLILAGLMVKTALFPFHSWLPRAHSAAPTPVSAMLSGLVIKASFYVVLRLWAETFPDALHPSTGAAIGILATMGILWGSLRALREANLKLVIAQSTLAQVGYLFLVLALLAPDSGTVEDRFDAWSGGVYQMLSHAFAKASLFLCAGTVLYALGNDRLVNLRGLSRSMPMTAFAFGIGGIALIGLPPTGSFIAKWLLLLASMEAAPIWAGVIAAGTLLSGAYVFRVVRLAFMATEDQTTVRRPPRVMEFVSLTLAIVAVVLGLRATEILDLLQVGAPFVEGR